MLNGKIMLDIHHQPEEETEHKARAIMVVQGVLIITYQVVVVELEEQDQHRMEM
jgi:hypothetical protein